MSAWAARLAALADVTLFGVARAIAAEEGGHHAAHHEAGIPWATLLFSVINLGIFAAILSRYAMPAVRAWVRERRDRVVQDLETAAAAKAEALKLRDEWRTRLAQFEATVEAMRAQTQRDAEQERERVLAAARKTADSILRDAERTAAYQIRRTVDQLRAELIERALEDVEKSIRAGWTAADQERFLAEFLKQVQA